MVRIVLRVQDKEQDPTRLTAHKTHYDMRTPTYTRNGQMTKKTRKRQDAHTAAQTCNTKMNVFKFKQIEGSVEKMNEFKNNNLIDSFFTPNFISNLNPIYNLGGWACKFMDNLCILENYFLGRNRCWTPRCEIEYSPSCRQISSPRDFRLREIAYRAVETYQTLPAESTISRS